ncbi:PTS fructose transporter subunit IIA [Aquabacterium lacunae]|uniref:PTS fructose transporter subunit IIA n=1 Tax=Aquabacterium lacunae TaxID=2528630 RepID=A0A4Q9GX77_9BURK|nr:PTS fructose transporter subunit IIA [Aquabacterium lacunae]TBO30203.1 PTS fructose transporter subunit IIA [Aquabacterium lacunae]
MPGLLIIAHAPLATALRQAAAHTFADAAEHIEALDVQANLSCEEIEAQARILLTGLTERDERHEALILTDVFGATPCNVVQRLADGQLIKVITGVNVPMLWRALNYRHEPLDTLVTRAVAGGTQGVMQIASPRPQNQAIHPSHDQDHRHHQQ